MGFATRRTKTLTNTFFDASKLKSCKIPPPIQRVGHVETVAEWFRTAAPEQGTVARVVTELYDAAYRPRAVAILIFDPLGLL